MKVGNLQFEAVESRLELIAETVGSALKTGVASDVLMAAIDPTLSDTAAFCEHYKIGLEISVNCVIVEAKRAERIWYAACLIRATDRIDINNIVRRQLDARKISFAPMDTAVRLSRMEYGGICPIGLPNNWPILIDTEAAALPQAIIGSGIRGSKLLASGIMLASLPNATVINLART